MIIGCSASAPQPPLPTVESVDLTRYLGTWYEVASLPNRFQKGCVATQAEYSLRDDGDIKVVNTCRDETLDGEISSATGHAWVVEPKSNAKLKVSFFWPFTGDYWILKLDPEYKHVLVGTAHRKYFWILSRSRTLDETVLQDLLQTARNLGYDVDKSSRTLQPRD